VVNDQVQSGHWQLTGAARASSRQGGSGTWDAGKQPIGQCQQQQNSGGQGIFSNTYDLGKCGPFPFTYQAYTIPDRLQIFQDENLIFDTGGPVSGGATVTVDASGTTSLVRVVVIASLEGTAWDYTVGCPQ
jgi:hypothetical protein